MIVSLYEIENNFEIHNFIYSQIINNK